MGSISPEPNPNPRRWRYTWEGLAHIPTLRLYLFQSQTNPLIRCRSLSASLRHGESKLLVSWVDPGGEDVAVGVPVPRVLIDPGCPVDCKAREDHIEVKMGLVLPVDHPVVADLRRVLGQEGEAGMGVEEDRFRPLQLESDLKNLSSEGVDFFCKTCSTKLTKEPLRCFEELPSMNWQEAADNWFGTCCCSFGGVSEKLVSKYAKAYECTRGKCLLDLASVIVSNDDLQEYSFDHFSDGLADHAEIVDLLTNIDLTDEFKEECCGDGTKCVSPPMGNTDAPQPSTSEEQGESDLDLSKIGLNCCSVDLETPFSCLSEEYFSSKCQDHSCIHKAKISSNHAYGRSFLGGSMIHRTGKHSTECSMRQERQICLVNSSLGGGFVVKEFGLSHDVEWVEVLCKNCRSPIGSYPTFRNRKFPIDGGIRLFKCCISTSNRMGEPRDVFRKHTLQRVFMELLLENALDEITFRTIVRDLRTRCPMLQIVILSSKTWSSTGYCFEDLKLDSIPETDLELVVKVLFSDCSTATGVKSRTIDEWSARNHAGEVFMLTSQIQDLSRYLNRELDRLPPSCSCLHGMSLSFMER